MMVMKLSRRFKLIVTLTLISVLGGVAIWILLPRTARVAMRQQARLHFPDAAARADAQFGVRIIRDGKRIAPSADDLAAHIVLLVHGVDDPDNTWNVLLPALQEAAYIGCELIYPNDQPIPESAAFLGTNLRQLYDQGVREVTIVAHSMGGLVTREFLTNPDMGITSGEHPRVRRLIMVGTPNHGSDLARVRFGAELRDHAIRIIDGRATFLGAVFDGLGEAQFDLEPGSEFLIALNARPHPPVPYTIIAGIASPMSDEQFNSLGEEMARRFPQAAQGVISDAIAGLCRFNDYIGDGCVPLESTRLAGVDDHVTVEGTHLTIIRHLIESRGGPTPPAVPIILDRLKRDE